MTKLKIIELKLRLAWALFKEIKGTYIKTCGYCEGILFDKIEYEGTTDYNGKFRCCSCGAIGTIREIWKYNNVIEFQKEYNCEWIGDE